MTTKEIVKTIENLTGLYFEISINDNQTEAASTFNPEKINYEYFNVCEELESYFTELYLDGNNLILERILYLLNDGLELWNRVKVKSFYIKLNFDNKELEHLTTTLTDEQLLQIAEIKTHYIQSLISKIDLINEMQRLPPQPISVNESRTKKVISETITNIDKQGWQYAFVSEYDYNLFTDLLTNFFEYKPYTLPETIIQLKRTCKTKVAKALGEIHKELSNENKLSTDTEYFQLIRVLSHFEKETEGDLYKALTR